MLFGSWGCTAMAPRPPITAEKSIRKIVVFPFQLPPDTADKNACLRCPICGRVYRSGFVAPIIGPQLTTQLVERLQQVKTLTVVGIEAGEKERLKATVCDFGAEMDIQALLQAGQSRNADGVLIGYIFRYEDRQGSDYAVSSPASVAFDLHLISVPTGEVVWQAAFDQTQAALSDNLFNIDTFIQRKGRWVSADELAAEGLAGLLDTHMEP